MRFSFWRLHPRDLLKVIQELFPWTPLRDSRLQTHDFGTSLGTLYSCQFSLKTPCSFVGFTALKIVHPGRHDMTRDIQGRREGEMWQSFPGPRDVWGPRHRSKILKMA